MPIYEHDANLVKELAAIMGEAMNEQNWANRVTAAEEILDYLVIIRWRSPSRGIQLGNGNVQVNSF